MAIVNYILLALFFCLTPAAVMWLCSKSKVLGAIGPVLILYAIGVVAANTGLLPKETASVQEILSNAIVPLAIPLMLFGCKFRKSETKTQFLAMITGLLAVAIAAVAGFFVFRNNIEDPEIVGGMLTGVYTGGTINLAALKAMLGADDSTYILLNSCDILISFLYLTFLLTVGIRLFRKFLPVKATGDAASAEEEPAAGESKPRSGRLSRETVKKAATVLGLTLLICAVSGGVALLLPQSAFMVVFILMLTTLGIACSFIRKVREIKCSYDMGMYFIYIFCIVVASMADLSQLNIAGSLSLLGYLTCVVFGSLLIQSIFAKIFKIDADTMIISSVSFINSPPFVPMMAAAMKNRNVIITGLSIGVIGYAAGNYLGFLIYKLLMVL